jgi:hypothetical protein
MTGSNKHTSFQATQNHCGVFHGGRTIGIVIGNEATEIDLQYQNFKIKDNLLPGYFFCMPT